MDLSDSDQPQNDNIRKIEDIIDMRKANGNYRQVAFSLSSETESTEAAAGRGGARDAGGGAGGAGLARSQESGLARPAARARALSLKKKQKKLKHKRRKSPLPDVISWPSDSDITVLRMKLCLADAGPQPAGDVVPAGGLHRPDGSSMVNLATLVLNSRSPSKRSLNIEEYLLPLSSWERAPPPQGVDRETSSRVPAECKVFGATCSHSAYYPEKPSTKESETDAPKVNAKCKVARFLRLYFCPCCTCLYEMEMMREEPSEYEARRPAFDPTPSSTQ